LPGLTLFPYTTLFRSSVQGLIGKMRVINRCERAECRRPLPKLAVEHADTFCSTVCAKIAFGVYRPTAREMAHRARTVGRDRPEEIGRAPSELQSLAYL